MKTLNCAHCNNRPECGAYFDAQIEAAEHCEAMGWMPAPGDRLPDCPVADNSERAEQ